MHAQHNYADRAGAGSRVSAVKPRQYERGYDGAEPGRP